MDVDNVVAILRADPVHFVPAVLGRSAYEELAREIIRLSKIEELEARQDREREHIAELKRQTGKNRQ